LAWLPTIASHLPRNIGTFAVTAVVVAAMAGPGALVLRLFGVTWHDRFEHWVFSLAAGLAAWVPVVLVTGSTVGLGRGTVVVITVV
jgi:hypothetical protein